MRTNIEELKENKIVQKLNSIQKIFSKELWKQLFRKLVWKTIPRYRNVDYLAKHLDALPQETPEAIKHARNKVFREIALNLKSREERRALTTLLNRCQKPGGIEQIFFTAIYPFIRKRNFVVLHHPTNQPNRMDIELGYEGHFNEYVFWILEIDGTSDERAGRVPRMRWEVIDKKKCPIYHIGAAVIFERKSTDSNKLVLDLENVNPTELIVNAQNIFVAIHDDLKNYGYRDRQPKDVKSIAETATNLSLVEKWEMIKQAAKKRAQRQRR